MTDTLWSDISEWQVPVTDAYPYGLLCIRSNDGGYLDRQFAQNVSWCRSAVQRGKLWGFLVYYFYRPASNGAAILMSRVGPPDPHLAVMIDVEGAGGNVTGDQSATVNAQYAQLAHWLGDTRRVIGYGNTHDLDSLWPHKPPGLRLVIAAYGSDPDYPGKFAHQFSDNAPTAPFGPSDLNSADGMSATDVQHMLGIGAAPPAPTPPPPPPPPTPAHRNTFTPLAVDGVPTLAQMQTLAAYQTVKALQFVTFHGNTAQCDGKFGINSAKSLQAHVGVAVDGQVGPATVRAVQARVHATQDGVWGSQTTASLQHALNVGIF